MHMGKKETRVLAALTVAAIAAAALAATAGGQSSAGPNLAYVKKQIDLYRAVPKFVAPGPPVNASKAKGKKLFIIPASSAVPFVETIADGVKTAGKRAGLNVSEWKNQGQPSQWVQGFGQAITQGVSSIDLLAGIDPASVQPQIKEAKAKGIPTVVSHLYDLGQAKAPNIGGTVDILYNQAGKLLADWAILETKGKLNALVVTINQVPSTKPMVAGIKTEVSKYCGSGCKLAFTDVTISEIATKIQPAVQSALVRDPSLNYVIALYDSAEVPFVIAGIKQANAVGKVKVATFNGTPSILKEVGKGIVSMDIGEPLDWIAYGIVDQHLRLLTGQKQVKNPRLPIRIFDKTNVGQAGSPPVVTKGYGSAYKDGYLKLWGLK